MQPLEQIVPQSPFVSLEWGKQLVFSRATQEALCVKDRASHSKSLLLPVERLKWEAQTDERISVFHEMDNRNSRISRLPLKSYMESNCLSEYFCSFMVKYNFLLAIIPTFPFILASVGLEMNKL